MSGDIERRALLALYRNHPATAPGDRYKRKALSEATILRDMLLGWAATQSDETLLDCRNLGPTTLRWIRDQTGDSRSPSRTSVLAEALHTQFDDFLCRVFEDIDVPAHHDMPPAFWTAQAAAILAALDAAGWTLEKKAEGEQIMVLSADHERLVGWVTFGKDEGTVHQHDLFAFHAHEDAP